MRIMIVTGIFPPDIGGPATYVPQIAKALAERGHAITVLTLSDRTDHDDGGYPFPVIRIRRGMFKPWRRHTTVFKIVSAGRKADVLFVNGLVPESVLANRIIKKPMVQKVVGDWAWERATNKGWTTDNFEEFQKKTYDSRIERMKRLRTWWAKKADRIIVPSQYLARWVETWGIPKDKMTVIYNAVEPVNGVKPATIPLETPTKIITVGRLVKWKNVDLIIDAITKMDDVGLVIVGDGPEKGALKKRAIGKGISNRIYFAGSKPKAETLSLMASSDIFVLVSAYEGFPHVIIEAMSLGLPVLTTNVGGIPEIITNNEDGIIIENAIIAELTKQIKNLSGSKPDLERISKKAKLTARKYEPDALFAITFSVFKIQ